MKKLLLSLILAVSLLAAFLYAPTTIMTANAASAAACQKGSFFGLTPWYKYLTFDKNCDIVMSKQVVNKDGKTANKNYDATEVWLIVFALAEMLLQLAGIIAVVFVFVGGFKYLTSMATPEKISNAKDTIINALVGVVIAIIASQTVAYVASKIMRAHNNNYGLPSTTADNLTVIFEVLFGIMGAISLLVVTLAGFNMILGRGDPQKIAKSRSTIIYAMVGLVVSIFAVSIVGYVLKKVVG